MIFINSGEVSINNFIKNSLSFQYIATKSGMGVKGGGGGENN